MARMRNQLMAKKYSATQWRELIDDWIFSTTHREIVKDWLLNGMTEEEQSIVIEALNSFV